MMRSAGRFNAQLMDFIRPYVREGISTGEIDRLVDEYTRDHGHTPACLGYEGESRPFPRSCCTSVNDVICHGIPGPYVLSPGDIVNLDLTTIVDGWHGDQSETFLIGEVEPSVKAVVQCAFDSLHLAVDALKPNCPVSLIGETIVAFVRKQYGFGVVDKYVGHGIGTKFHQRPNIPHVPTRQARFDLIVPGLCFTIEPMINQGTVHSYCDARDGWTVRTRDGKPSAQFEHTILMTETGPEILTLTQFGPQKGHRF
jgi:methionyl aminopeptidase